MTGGQDVTATELVLEGTIIESKTPEQWANVIRADLGQAVAGFVAAGQHLATARRQIKHGDWESWCKQQVGISSETARRLILISEHPAIANPNHSLDLPPSWQTLYELRALDAPLLEAAIAAHDIHPELERKHAAALVVEYKKAAAIEAAKSVQRGDWWQLSDHLLYCGDSADEAFTSQVSGQLAFADPPYNAGKAEWDHDFTWRHDYLADVADVVAVTPGISAIPDFHATTKMPYHWAMAAWITNGMTRGALGFGNWIYIALFSQQESLHRNMQDHLRINVSSAAPSTRHESRKPAELLVALIEAFTEPGETVIDPFLGSGTTLFAADQSGRKCVGAEIEPEFCAEILARYGPEVTRL